ncbi:uncharacterized protein SPSK_01986 [Sporothrix schenckii 1099-18]|uniref:Uncharacterized protein n=1 Tax=Sporothrix schenckii 1099-18 TaxID=1397361 RepID=A0A0F2MCH7_SPOSC|nr:uncharacterized protein SPSK_01986 [Sporothrix schenckii 1099-18]KJR87347.1 hypothetical protein SPSK_01986 [Sporothrix schenckii 1099-18]
MWMRDWSSWFDGIGRIAKRVAEQDADACIGGRFRDRLGAEDETTSSLSVNATSINSFMAAGTSPDHTGRNTSPMHDSFRRSPGEVEPTQWRTQRPTTHDTRQTFGPGIEHTRNGSNDDGYRDRHSASQVSFEKVYCDGYDAGRSQALGVLQGIREQVEKKFLRLHNGPDMYCELPDAYIRDSPCNGTLSWS